MHPACDLCRGACCETLVLPLPRSATKGERKWLELRGRREEIAKSDVVRVPCRCLVLSSTTGRCMIYDDRPQPCRDFPVGGEQCRAAVASLRPESKQAILSRMRDE